MYIHRSYRLDPLKPDTFVKAFATCGLLSVLLIIPAVSKPEDGEQVYKAKCAACHTLGKGPLVGPDLAPGKSWTDANLVPSIKRMEKTVGALTDADVNNLVEFLKNPVPSGGENKATETDAQASAAPETDKAAETAETKSSTIEGGSALEGAELFDGRRAFKNGGMACNACHSLDGTSSTMGPDLGNISERMNEAALAAACQQTPFKVMKTAYAEHPVTKQEAVNLAKYFESIKGQKQPAEKLPLNLCGAAGSVLILALVALGYRNRNSGVRNKLHRR